MSLKLALSAVVAALALNSAAVAQEEQFTLTYGLNGNETFDLNVSDGNSDSYSVGRFEIEDDLYYGITNDSLGNDSVWFSAIYFHNHEESVGIETENVYDGRNDNLWEGDRSIYRGGSTLNVALGRSYSVGLGTLTVSAVSATPEPSTWALMFLGTAMAGGMLQYNRRRQTAGFSV